MIDIHPLDWKQVLILALLGGFVLTFVLARVDRTVHSRRALLSVYFLFMTGYAFGVALEANALLDGSRPQVFAVRVANKSETPPTWNLHLDPWGTRQQADVMVSRALYETVNPGDRVCVVLRAGMLGIAWYVVTSCR